MNSLLTYDIESEQGVDSQIDPLIGDVKVELDIKSEPEDECDMDITYPKVQEAEEQIEDDPSDLEPIINKLKLVNKKKRKCTRIKTKKKPETYNESSESNSDDEFLKPGPRSKRKTKTTKVKEKRKKSKRGRPKKGLEFTSHQEEMLPEVKDAVFSTFLCGEGGALGRVNYKGVELRRSAINKGYSLGDEELDRFKTEDNGKVEFNCEDCDYSVEYKNAFKVHFVMHANVYFIMESINKTLNKRYCHLCYVECGNDVELSRHVKTHKSTKGSEKKAKATKKVVDEEEDTSEDYAIEDVLEDEDFVPKPESLKIQSPTPLPPPPPVRRASSRSSDEWSDGGIDLFGDFVDTGHHSDDEKKEEKKDEHKDASVENVNIVSGNIMLEIEVPNTMADDKKVVEIKKEVDVSTTEANYVNVEELCRIKVEKPDADPNLMFSLKNEIDIKMERCKICKYETEEGFLNKHNCRDVRQCDMCDKILLNQRIFRYHRKLHFCDKCSFKSNNLNDVSEHRKFSSNCWSKCANCEFQTMNTQSYERHIKSKTCFKDKTVKMERSAENLQCDTCAYTTPYKEILIKHIKQHKNWKYSGEDAFMCNLCSKSCYSRTTLTTHYKSHYCYKCAFMSLNTQEVLEHKKNNPDCLYKCTYCNFTTPHQVSLRRHERLFCTKNYPNEKSDDYGPYKPGKGGRKGRKLKLSKNLRCDQCPYKTHSKVYLTWHIMKHTDPKPFHCSKCDFKCSQKGNLLTHEKKHIDGKTYCCTVCDFQCSYYKVFLIHKKIHGAEETEAVAQKEKKERDPRFFYCERCEFRTKYPQYLKNHNLKHDNIRPYLCDFCGVTFSSLIDYHVHKNHAHRTQPPKMYKCSYCDYSYSNKGTVKIHERKHTGAKPHSCEFCSYSTSYAGNLRAHKKKHFKNNMELPQQSDSMIR